MYRIIIDIRFWLHLGGSSNLSETGSVVPLAIVLMSTDQQVGVKHQPTNQSNTAKNLFDWLNLLQLKYQVKLSKFINTKATGWHGIRMSALELLFQ